MHFSITHNIWFQHYSWCLVSRQISLSSLSRVHKLMFWLTFAHVYGKVKPLWANSGQTELSLCSWVMLIFFWYVDKFYTVLQISDIWSNMLVNASKSWPPLSLDTFSYSCTQFWWQQWGLLTRSSVHISSSYFLPRTGHMSTWGTFLRTAIFCPLGVVLEYGDQLQLQVMK